MATAPSILTATFHGIQMGSNLAVQPHEIPDNMARYIQDSLLDQPGIIRLRGPVKQATSTPTPSGRAQGIVQTTAVDGTSRIAVLTGNSPTNFRMLNSALTAVASTYSLGSIGAQDKVILDSKPTLKKGNILGAASAYSNAGSTSILGKWRGGTLADYSLTGCTLNRKSSSSDSKQITGGASFTTKIEPGMFVINSTKNALVGVVYTVDSATACTLEENPLCNIANTDTVLFTAVRGLVPRVMKGRITVNSGQTQVNGAGTKFTYIGQAAGTWDLYRFSDNAYIGQISSVQNDRQLTLSAGSNFSLSNERFQAVQRGVSGIFSAAMNAAPSVPLPGFLNATFQGFQFYANNPSTADGSSTVWFSDTAHEEGIDMATADGDFFRVTSQTGGNTPITAIAGLQNALAIFKDQELFALFGNDPTNFQLRKIADVGTWCGMTVQTYQNGVVFASRNGIYQFDGVRLTSLTDSLGDWWKEGVKNLTGRAWSGIYRDHYFLYVDGFNSGYQLQKGAVSITPAKMVVCINLLSNATTFMTNMSMRGMVALPSSAGLGSWFVAHDSTPQTFICDMASMWNTTGADQFTMEGETVGPDFYVESKRYDLGDAERKKLFKQIAMQYLLTGDTLSIDTIPGLNSTGITANSQWLPSTVYVNKRIKFLKRATHLGFRLYETNGTVTNVEIGPWALGYKPQRLGRT